MTCYRVDRCSPARGTVPDDSCFRALFTVLEGVKQHVMSDVVAEVTHKDVAVTRSVLSLVLLERPVDSHLHCIAHELPMRSDWMLNTVSIAR